MFDAIAPRYDLLNRIMTFRLDVRWRRRAVRRLDLPDGSVVLDLACGTGDLCRDLDGAGLAPIGMAMFPAAWAIANDRRWGWRLGIAAAVLNVLLPLQWYGLGRPMSLAFALLFPVVLLVLLVHPVSREHQRIWFE